LDALGSLVDATDDPGLARNFRGRRLKSASCSSRVDWRSTHPARFGYPLSPRRHPKEGKNENHDES